MFCSKAAGYGNLFKDGEHYVEFASDLSDFDDKLFYYLSHEDEAKEIIDKAYQHVIENHTWERRIQEFTDSVMKNVLS